MPYLLVRQSRALCALAIAFAGLNLLNGRSASVAQDVEKNAPAAARETYHYKTLPDRVGELIEEETVLETQTGVRLGSGGESASVDDIVLRRRRREVMTTLSVDVMGPMSVHGYLSSGPSSLPVSGTGSAQLTMDYKRKMVKPGATKTTKTSGQRR